MRRPYVVGNWKMNATLAEARALVGAIRQSLPKADRVDVGIAPPATLLLPMCKALADSPIRLGAQNVYCEPSGAYTGEISPTMLVDAFCRFVIIGHSERRQIFGESGELLRRKVTAAIAANLAKGEKLEKAVLQAKRYITGAIRKGFAIGSGHSPVHHFYHFWKN